MGINEYNAMKKILFITGSLFGGGAEKRMIELANYMHKKNKSVFLGVLNLDKNYLNKIDSGISIINLKMLGKSFFGLAPIIKIFFLNYKLKIDLNFSNLYRTNSYLLILKYLFPNVKIITSIVTDPKRHKKRILSNFYYLSDIIITNASKNINHIHKYFNVPKENIIFIPNGVDLNKILNLKKQTNPNEIQINPKKFNLLYVGSLSKVKGVDILIKAFALVEEKIDCELIIVGSGNYEQELKSFVRQLKIEKNVNFVGKKINPYPYFGLADIFILASRSEGMPNVLLEAMACKLPIIATNTGLGVNDIIVDGYNGILARLKDEKDLAKQIIFLSKNEDLAEKFKNNGIKLIKEKFKISQMYKAYSNVFSKF